jgi:type I site-specific restriction endonuclease
MQPIEPITIINVDDVPHAVSDMSPDVKRLVEFYNDWRNEENQVKSEILKVQASMRDLSREIVATIKKEQDAKDASDAAVADAAARLEEEAKAEVPAPVLAGDGADPAVPAQQDPAERIDSSAPPVIDPKVIGDALDNA